MHIIHILCWLVPIWLSFGIFTATIILLAEGLPSLDDLKSVLAIITFGPIFFVFSILDSSTRDCYKDVAQNVILFLDKVIPKKNRNTYECTIPRPNFKFKYRKYHPVVKPKISLRKRLVKWAKD